jgi:tetratricopeptide (TPR) repeat protein
MGVHLDRALILFEQSRPELAEQELRQELAAEPNSPVAHALLALCLAKREQFGPATQEAELAVHLGPDLAYPHYVLASVLEDRHRLAEAEQAVRRALELDPHDADSYALLSGIRFGQRRWADALEAAEQGLQVDAEHVGCTNLRAMALVKLGRKAEAGATIDAALARDPENALTHANQGWTLLEQGQPHQAMEHFREALRLDPELDWARSGIVEALKARHLIYRLMLRYFLWMSKLSRTAQWGVIIGGYFGQRYLSQLAERDPRWQPYVLPVMLLYILFVVLTWTASPLFNLLLRLNRFGRLALSREQIVASNWIGSCLLLALAVFLYGLAGANAAAMAVAVPVAAFMIPLSATFNCEAGWPRWVMGGYSALLGFVGATALVLFLVFDNDLFVLPGSIYLSGLLLAMILGNVLAMVEVRR